MVFLWKGLVQVFAALYDLKNSMIVMLTIEIQIRRDLGRIEKWVLRNAFDDDKDPYLPKV